MLEKGKFRDDFFRKRIFEDRLPALIISVAVLILTYLFLHKYLIYVGGLLILFFLLDLPANIRKYKHHVQFVNWLDRNEKITILAYSSKVKYLELIEKHIVPECDEKLVVVKLIDGRIKGNIRKTVWYELSKRAKIHHLPVIIKIEHRYFQVIPIRRFLNEFIETQVGMPELNSRIKSLVDQRIIAGD